MGLVYVRMYSMTQEIDNEFCRMQIEICIYINVTQYMFHTTYRQVPNIRRTFVGNKIVDHSDVVGASPVGAAPTTSSFST